MCWHAAVSAARELRGTGLNPRAVRAAGQDGCGVHMGWDPGPRILTLIFRTTVARLINPAFHATSHMVQVWAAHVCTRNTTTQ